MRGTTVLNPDGPLVVDNDGRISFGLMVNEAAATGIHPIVIIGENPAAPTIAELKGSPRIALTGQDSFASPASP